MVLLKSSPLLPQDAGKRHQVIQAPIEKSEEPDTILISTLLCYWIALLNIPILPPDVLLRIKP